jgi:hypothetical protein
MLSQHQRGASKHMDTQQVELMGRNRLVNELIAAGIEVALPLRDRGIDVIAYLDRDDSAGRFLAVPIQMKASSKRRFGLDKKYLRTKNIVVAFVWNIGCPAEEKTYALTYSEAATIVQGKTWAKTDSWVNKGGYNTTVGKQLHSLLNLDRYLMTPEKWRWRAPQELSREI